jgi:hypothetical protein
MKKSAGQPWKHPLDLTSYLENERDISRYNLPRGMGLLTPPDWRKIHKKLDSVSPVTGYRMRNVDLPDIIDHRAEGWLIQFWYTIKEVEVSDIMDRCTLYDVFLRRQNSPQPGPLTKTELITLRNLISMRAGRFRRVEGSFDHNMSHYQKQKNHPKDPTFVKSAQKVLLETSAKVANRLTTRKMEHVNIPTFRSCFLKFARH